MKYQYLMSILLASGAVLSCKGPETADFIVKNSKIYTVDGNSRIAESFAVRGGLILAVGSDQEIDRSYNSDQVIDLGGKPVYPGFYDAHCHFAGYADNLRKADLTDTKSFGEICQRLVEHQKSFPSEWVLGRGWDQNDWPGRQFPDRSELDTYFPDLPVYLTRVDGHAAVVNTAALKLAGIDYKTRVTGGEIICVNGKITGVLVDNAMDLVSRFIPDMPTGESTKALLRAQENCFAVGLTTVADAGLSFSTVQLMDQLHKEGQLKMRVYAMLSPSEDNFEGYVKKGIYKSDRLNVRSVKLFADGALGSRGALMLEPYSDAPEKTGLQVNESDFLRNLCQKCYDAGYQVETHCIGDAANRLMLNIYKEILREPNDRRWRIEHAQIIHSDDFQLFRDFSIIPSVQMSHATSDMYWAEDRVGPERIKGAYAYKKLLGQNGWLPNGSDFPVEKINPLFGFFAGFARMDQSGFPDGGWHIENALTREESLRAMTIWAAKSCFEENERGSLEPGKMADFVVLEEDIMTADPLRVPKIKVLQTWIGGEVVYGTVK
ncbi:MAG: amidohydrolase [Bacteroidetes bacterium GWF2_49_14]|nr:MAG: amidohydrolase [Bacteroidetes bacterium GWF2_49_14]